MVYALLFLAAALGGVFALFYTGLRQGRKNAEGAQDRQALEDIRHVRAARDNLGRDAGAVERLRQRFTRKLL